MNATSFKIAINILLYSSWILAWLGLFIGYYLFAPLGLITGLIGAFLLTSPGLFLIVCIQLFFIQKDKLIELKRQSEILKSIENKLSK